MRVVKTELMPSGLARKRCSLPSVRIVMTDRDSGRLRTTITERTRMFVRGVRSNMRRGSCSCFVHD